MILYVCVSNLVYPTLYEGTGTTLWHSVGEKGTGPNEGKGSHKGTGPKHNSIR